MKNHAGPFDQKFIVPVRTELQVSPHEGVRGIKSAQRRFRTEGEATPLLATPPGWTKQAKCLDDWKAYAGDGEPGKVVAKVLCGGCPVLEECRDSALEEEGDQLPRFRAGIRGGLTPSERHTYTTEPKKCVRDHARAEHGSKRSDGRWYCLECERILAARVGECSCGHEGTAAAIRTHRKRKGCPPAAVPGGTDPTRKARA